MHASEFTTGNRQVARNFGAARENHRVEICQQSSRRKHVLRIIGHAFAGSCLADTDAAAELATRAKAIRALLDSRGFTKTESHLNEWNFLPGNSWDVLSRKATPETRQRAAEQIAGAPGGTFLAASLIELQDAPVDVCNFYHGETGGFGLFTEAGAPTRNYHAFLAFAGLLETPRRVHVSGTVPGKLAVASGTDAARTEARVLVANLSGAEEIRIAFSGMPWPGETALEVRIVDAARALELLPNQVLTAGEFTLHLPAPAVALVTLRARTN